MANTYYAHMIVETPQEASIFSDEYTWTILEVLRKAGSKGLTAIEVHQRVEDDQGVSVSRSKIYSLLRRLYEDEFVDRYYDQEAQSQRNTVRALWGEFIFNEEYYDAAKTKLMNYIKKNMFPAFQEYLEKALSEFQEDPKTKKWLPQDGKTNMCKRCRLSHEAEEFFYSLLDIARAEFTNSNEFSKLLENNRFAYIEKND